MRNGDDGSRSVFDSTSIEVDHERLLSPVSLSLTNKSPAGGGFVRLNVERLEERDVPAIFHVNTLDDTSDFNLGDHFPSDANGNTSLRSAIEQSNATGNGVVSVEFDFGLADENNEIILTLTKSLGITTKISIDGNYGFSKYATIKGTGGFSLLVNEAIDTTFSNMVFQGNDAGKNNNGGAIQNKSHLTVDTCEFLGNKSGKGGAIANNADGKLTIGDSTFTSNSTGNEGGAIYAADSSHVEIYWSTFTGNTAVSWTVLV